MFSGASQNIWINLIGFNLIWLMCILLGNSALVLVSLLLLLHLLFHKDPITEVLVILTLGMIGYGIDCLLTLLDFFQFSEVQGITPIWLLFLWFSFSATFRQSLSILRSRYLISIPLGALGGAFAYLAAANLGAVSLSYSMFYSGLSIAIIWAVLFPFLMWVSNTLEGALCAN